MQATFYEFSGDPIIVDKSSYLSRKGSANIDFYYKEDTELVNPTFICMPNKDIKRVNYIHVSELKRYYYVDDVIYKQDHIELVCTVDVLMSFKDDIDKLYTIIIRTQSADPYSGYNLYISDNKIRTESQLRIVTLNFERGFQVGENKSSNFILTINGGGAS